MKVACTLLPYIDFRYGVLPLREEGRITRLRRGVVCSEVAAQEKGRGGNQPEPSERRVTMGLYKYTFFRNKASFKVSFSSGEDGFFQRTIIQAEASK